MKAVHFGAGSIGRGFIADLLHESGYELVLVDLNDVLIQQINRQNQYHLYIIEKDYEQKTIDQVSALSSIKDSEQVTKEIVEADILTTSVWADNLSKVAPAISAGLLERLHQRKERINVLACENAMFNSEILKKEILKLKQLSEGDLDSIAAFPNTAVDRMVLEDERNGEKVINIGVDYELVIERNKLVNPEVLPVIGAEYTNNLEKYIERKLYIINCGHAWAGYLGAVNGYQIMADIFSDEKLVSKTKEAMNESARLLAKKYRFSMLDLQEYIDFAIRRFQTPGVIDTVNRVCRSPIRKLEPTERLVGPAVQCEKNQLKNDCLLEGIAAVFLFDNSADRQSQELLAYVADKGISEAIFHYTELSPKSRMHQEILSKYKKLRAVKGEEK